MSLYDHAAFRTTVGTRMYVIREDLFDLDGDIVLPGRVIEVEDWATDEYVTLEMTDSAEWREIKRTPW